MGNSSSSSKSRPQPRPHRSPRPPPIPIPPPQSGFRVVLDKEPERNTLPNYRNTNTRTNTRAYTRPNTTMMPTVSPASVRSPRQQQRRLDPEEAFAYFVEMHNIPSNIQSALWTHGVDGRHDWQNIAYQYAYLPKLAWLHKIQLSKTETHLPAIHKKHNKNWRTGDIIINEKDPNAGELNYGKLVWTGRKLVEMDFEMDGHGSIPTEVTKKAMEHPYFWSGQDAKYGDIIKSNHAIPVAFDSTVAKQINSTTTSTCVFTFHGKKWGVIIDPSMRGMVLDAKGVGTLFWIEMKVVSRNPQPFGLYKVDQFILKDPRIRALLKQGVPYERILSASEEF